MLTDVKHSLFLIFIRALYNYLINISLMHLTADKVKLLSKGCNSSIYHLHDEDLDLVLKVVPSGNNKETKHLSN